MAQPNTNFIQHFNDFIKVSQQDKGLTGNHMSLYFALFSIWNQCYFRNPFKFSRKRVLAISHIGSRATYIKCMKDLANWGYIEYFPSVIKGQLSSVSLVKGIRPKNEPGAGSDMPLPRVKTDTPAGPNVGHIINNTNSINNERGNAPPPNKKMERPESLNDVVVFFHLLGHPETEAAKFFNHYEANGWLQAGKVPITNWPAAARKWILNIYPNQNPKNGKRTKTGSLNTNQDKSYSDPL